MHIPNTLSLTSDFSSVNFILMLLHMLFFTAAILLCAVQNQGITLSFFVHFSAVPARLLWGRERQAMNSAISVWTRAGPLSSAPTQQSKWVTWDNCKMVWRDAESIFQRSFHGRRRCRFVRSQLVFLNAINQRPCWWEFNLFWVRYIKTFFCNKFAELMSREWKRPVGKTFARGTNCHFQGKERGTWEWC